MTKPCITDAQARKGFTVSLLVSLVLGVALGYYAYGNLLDFRAWNVIGVVVIFGVAGWAGFAALRAAACRDSDA